MHDIARMMWYHSVCMTSPGWCDIIRYAWHHQEHVTSFGMHYITRNMWHHSACMTSPDDVLSFGMNDTTRMMWHHSECMTSPWWCDIICYAWHHQIIWYPSVCMTSPGWFDIIRYEWHHQDVISFGMHDIARMMWYHSVCMTSPGWCDIICYAWSHQIMWYHSVCMTSPGRFDIIRYAWQYECYIRQYQDDLMSPVVTIDVTRYTGCGVQKMEYSKPLAYIYTYSTFELCFISQCTNVAALNDSFETKWNISIQFWLFLPIFNLWRLTITTLDKQNPVFYSDNIKRLNREYIWLRDEGQYKHTHQTRAWYFAYTRRAIIGK